MAIYRHPRYNLTVKQMEETLASAGLDLDWRKWTPAQWQEAHDVLEAAQREQITRICRVTSAKSAR